MNAERVLLDQMLDGQREEVAALLDDVSETDARERLVPSLTTLLGLVKHCAFVERVWFHARIAGVPRADLGLPDDIDDSFRLDDGDTVASVRADFLAACERSRVIAAEHDLDEEFDWHGEQVSLRYAYVHLVAEYARHAGHGDILREQLAAH